MVFRKNRNHPQLWWAGENLKMGQKGFSCEIHSCADSVPRDSTDGSEILRLVLGRFSSVMADYHTQVQAHTTGTFSTFFPPGWNTCSKQREETQAGSLSPGDAQ